MDTYNQKVFLLKLKENGHKLSAPTLNTYEMLGIIKPVSRYQFGKRKLPQYNDAVLEKAIITLNKIRPNGRVKRNKLKKLKAKLKSA